MSPIRIQGWDVSSTHGGIVELELDRKTLKVLRTSWWAIYWNVEKDLAPVRKGHTFRVPNFGTKQFTNRAVGNDGRSIDRIFWWVRELRGMLTQRKPDYVVIEGYALQAGGKKGGGMAGRMSTGEQGCVIRMLPLVCGAKLRIIAPNTLKLFAAGNGRASKADMVSAVNKVWVDKTTFGKGREKLTVPGDGKGEDRIPDTDLADAMALARLGATEVRVKGGVERLDRLPEGQRRVFLKVSKSPDEDSLTTLPWITKPRRT